MRYIGHPTESNDVNEQSKIPVWEMPEVSAIDMPLALGPPRPLSEAWESDDPPPAPEVFPSIFPHELSHSSLQPRRQGGRPRMAASLLLGADPCDRRRQSRRANMKQYVEDTVPICAGIEPKIISPVRSRLIVKS